jgi:hypothetical protein
MDFGDPHPKHFTQLNCTEQTGSSGNASALYLGAALAGTSAILTEIFRYFPQSFQTNTEIMHPSFHIPH